MSTNNNQKATCITHQPQQKPNTKNDDCPTIDKHLLRYAADQKQDMPKRKMKEAFVLVGSLAAGKTYIGSLIEKSFGIPFFEYEHIFVQEQQVNPEECLKRAEPKAERAIFEFLEKHGNMCFENTMSRPYATEILKKLQQIADVRIIYVHAPFELALKRLQRREKGTHVEWLPEDIKSMYDKSENLGLDYDLVLDNQNLSNEELLHRLQPFMEERKWQHDHVEITFKGQTLKFSCWSGDKLTNYDMEYKPWKIAFKNENPSYLKHYELKPGDVVIDAGGYEGTFAIYAAKVVGEAGVVIVLEPDSENYKRLKENVELNELKNVILINKALWRKPDRLVFNDKHTAGSSFFGGSLASREIDVVSLDEELGKHGVTKVDFIKMDIEGSEIQALKGARNTLIENDTHLAIASYHIIDGKRTCTKIESILKDLGYTTETEFPHHPITYGSKIKVKK